MLVLFFVVSAGSALLFFYKQRSAREPLTGCLVSLALAGCMDRPPPPAIDIPGASPEIQAAAHKLVAACPGLTRFATSITVRSAQVMGSERPSPWAPPARIEIEVANDGSVPRELYAAGHHCYFDVDALGVEVAKSACASICAGERKRDQIYSVLLRDPNAPDVSAPRVRLKTNRIDASAAILNLPLTAHETSTSDLGYVRQRWKIDGVDSATLEVIGDDQSNARVMGWSCAEYDDNGSMRPASVEGSRCGDLLGTVLANFVDESVELKRFLLASVDVRQRDAVFESDGLSFEADPSGSYFVRQMKPQ